MGVDWDTTPTHYNSHHHYHCLRETLKVTVYHAGTSQDNDGRADKTGLDLDAYECVGGAPPTEPGKVV